MSLKGRSRRVAGTNRNSGFSGRGLKERLGEHDASGLREWLGEPGLEERRRRFDGHGLLDMAGKRGRMRLRVGWNNSSLSGGRGNGFMGLHERVRQAVGWCGKGFVDDRIRRGSVGLRLNAGQIAPFSKRHPRPGPVPCC